MDEPLLVVLDRFSRIEIMVGLILFLTLESARPFIPGRDGWIHVRHALGNFALWVLGYLLADVLLYPYFLPESSHHPGAIWSASLAGSPIWLQVVLGIVLLDFATWLLHWLSHRYRWLWLIHAVHHSDPRLDVTTALRNHPVERVISLAWHGVLLALVGLPLWILAVRALVAIPVGMFHHSNVRVPEGLDRIMRAVFVSPAMHRVHHSPDMPETNSNYGVVFSFWDRLFGTYHAPRAGERPSGLNALRAPAWQSLWGMLATPVRARHLREF